MSSRCHCGSFRQARELALAREPAEPFCWLAPKYSNLSLPLDLSHCFATISLLLCPTKGPMRRIDNLYSQRKHWQQLARSHAAIHLQQRHRVLKVSALQDRHRSWVRLVLYHPLSRSLGGTRSIGTPRRTRHLQNLRTCFERSGCHSQRRQPGCCTLQRLQQRLRTF